MNIDVRVLLAEGERALRADHVANARAAFLEAGEAASSYQLWRSALRCYRLALELDLVDHEPLARIMRLPPRTLAHTDWKSYVHALEHHAWPSFGCRSAQIITGGPQSHVECRGVGPVMELLMSSDDLIETRPEPHFVGMPFAMAMLILRRAMWMAPVDHATNPRGLRVAFDHLPQVWLDEVGDWGPLPESYKPHTPAV